MIYGIDLGTTFSAIARVNQLGEPVCVPLDDDGLVTLPSAVLFDGPRVYVGEQAIENSYKPEALLIEFAKRSIGLQKVPGWPVRYGEWNYAPEEVSALILRKIVRQVGAHPNLPPVREVVVTHPQWFYMPQKEATREAADLAGLDLVATITEPNAAAIAYGVYQQSGDRRATVLVFDLGGGTFDVSLVRVGRNSFEMLGSDGDTQLGGMDWDHAIIAKAKEVYLQAAGVDFDDVSSKEEEIALRKAAEKAKKKLSSQPEVGFWVTTEEGGKRRVELKREEFEAMTRPLLMRCLRRCEDVFAQTGLAWTEVDEVLLVGSSTKMPMVSEALRRAAGKEPRLDPDPKLMVAKGAALWAEWIRAGKIDPRAVVESGRDATGLEDRTTPTFTGRTAHGLGVLATRQQPGARGSAQAETFVDLLIKQNTPTPHVFEKEYITNRDDQTAIPVPLYEGDTEDPDECSRIGQVVIDKLPPRPKGQPVRVKFNIDTSGLLEVEATDLGTGNREVKRLDRHILRGESEQKQRPEADLAARRRHLDTLEVV